MTHEIETFHYNNKCDLWSLGVILYQLYINEYIFYSNNPEESNDNKKKEKSDKKEDNEKINKLIKKLIQVDIDKRLKWEEYFNDDFLFLIMNLIMNMNKL